MHRNGYKGSKFGRERDQRAALLAGLAESLILHTSIETTVSKAKEVVPYVEQLITKAKIGDLHNRRQIIASLQTLEAAHKLVEETPPKLNARNRGHLRITKTRARRGDNVLLARVSFVDDLTDAPVAKTAEKAVKTTKAKVVAKKPAAKKPSAAKTKEAK